MPSPIKISHNLLIYNHGCEFTQLTSDFFEQSKGKQTTCSEDRLYFHSILHQHCINSHLQCFWDGWGIRLIHYLSSVVITLLSWWKPKQSWPDQSPCFVVWSLEPSVRDDSKMLYTQKKTTHHDVDHWWQSRLNWSPRLFQLHNKWLFQNLIMDAWIPACNPNRQWRRSWSCRENAKKMTLKSKKTVVPQNMVMLLLYTFSLYSNFTVLFN